MLSVIMLGAAFNCYAECLYVECRNAEYHFTECLYTECRYLSVIMLNVIILSVIVSLCWVLLSLLFWASLFWLSLCWVSLRWVSLCGVSWRRYVVSIGGWERETFRRFYFGRKSFHKSHRLTSTTHDPQYITEDCKHLRSERNTKSDPKVKPGPGVMKHFTDVIY
jgi:hypothetical protein